MTGVRVHSVVDRSGAHELGSHAVLLITKYMLDVGAHLRARRFRAIRASLSLRLR
jgi:hypothetical protein